MNYFFKNYWVGLVGICLLSCQSPEIKKDYSAKPVNQAQLQIETDEIQSAEALIQKGKFDQALVKLAEFNKKYPLSTLKMQASLAIAKAHFGLSNWDSAKKEYQKIIRSTTEPNIRGLALFYLSFCHEAEGDEVRQFAALKDAENLSGDLPIDIREALLPSRLGIYYIKKGDQKLAENYFKKAEKGMRLLQQQNSKALIAETYAKMGQIQTPLSSDGDQTKNVSLFLENLKWHQIFLLKSIEVGDAYWSAKSALELKKNYENLFKLLNPSESYFEEDHYLEKQVMKDLSQRIQGSINLLKQAVVAVEENVFINDLNQFISKNQTLLEQKNLELSSPLPLTRENQKRSLQRNDAVIYSKPLFEEEKESFERKR